MMLNTVLEIGPFAIYSQLNGKLWISNIETDEGMECTEKAFVEAILPHIIDFWDDNF